jgi:hypothetical protein
LPLAVWSHRKRRKRRAGGAGNLGEFPLLVPAGTALAGQPHRRAGQPPEVLNPKSEFRNSKQFQNLKSKSPRHSASVLNFRIWYFEIVSDFGFRISIFFFKV